MFAHILKSNGEFSYTAACLVMTKLHTGKEGISNLSLSWLLHEHKSDVDRVVSLCTQIEPTPFPFYLMSRALLAQNGLLELMRE